MGIRASERLQHYLALIIEFMVSPNEPSSFLRRMNADDLYWEEVEEARNRSFEDKLLAGPRLFDRSCEFMRAGIRLQHPSATEDDIERILVERLELGRRLESRA